MYPGTFPGSWVATSSTFIGPGMAALPSLARSSVVSLLDLSGLSDSDSDVGGGNEESPVVMELGSGGAWQEKSREEGPYLSREEESVQTSTSLDMLQSPRLEIKRKLYNIFHGAMQYARNKGDMDLHRMISGSPRASS